uniref:hypothetical protein n=1 Tax=Shigella dysenteriae TaxID=622 RepID=UPI0036F1AB70
MNVNAGHERTSKARIIHQIQLIRGITPTGDVPFGPFIRRRLLQHTAIVRQRRT